MVYIRNHGTEEHRFDSTCLPMGQKMKIFNFELESKLDLHVDVKFDGECDGDGPES